MGDLDVAKAVLTGGRAVWFEDAQSEVKRGQTYSPRSGTNYELALSRSAVLVAADPSIPKARSKSSTVMVRGGQRVTTLPPPTLKLSPRSRHA